MLGTCLHCVCLVPLAMLRVVLRGLTDHNKEGKKNRLSITLDPGGHRRQRPYAQGRTFAKHEQAQTVEPGRR